METSLILRTPAWLRWTLFLPASVIVYLLIFAAVVLGGKLLNFFSTGAGWGDNFLQYLLGPAVAGYYAISASMVISPSRARPVLLALLALWMVIYGVMGGAACFTGDLKTLFAVAVSVVAALVALSAHEEGS